MNISQRHWRNSQTGFSLVEVMVGLAIGLISSIVIYQVLAVSEGYRRAASGGGEGTQNGALALYALERDIKQAGAGLELGRLGDALTVNEGARTVTGAILAPVVITPGAGNAADTIRVLYGAAVQNGDVKRIAAPGMATASASLTLTSVYGLSVGDIFIVAEAGNPAVMGHVTAIPAGTVNVDHTSTPVNGLNFNVAGFPVPYSPAAVVMNLGQIQQGREPALNEYAVNNNQLTLTRFLANSTPLPIADDVFTLKAQYGIDTDGDNVADTYQNTLPAGVGFAAVRSIRVAVLTRVNIFEKQAVSPASITLWPDSAAAPTTTGPVINLAGTDRNYRYRVFSTTVPLRNVVWPLTRVP